MLFHKNRNTQIQVCTIQRLELETGKTSEALGRNLQKTVGLITKSLSRQ